jgi:hypothetical protein
VYAAPLLTGVSQSSFRPNNRITENDDLRITQEGDQRIIEAEEGYLVWQHDRGRDEVDGQFITAIPSWFETADMSMLVGGNPQNKWIRVEMIEPDFVQSENMTVQLTGRANAKAKEVLGPERIVYANPSTPYEQVVWFKEERRELRFKFTSNTLNGDYQMGQIIAHVAPADGNVLGAVNDESGST